MQGLNQFGKLCRFCRKPVTKILKTLVISAKLPHSKTATSSCRRVGLMRIIRGHSEPLPGAPASLPVVRSTVRLVGPISCLAFALGSAWMPDEAVFSAEQTTKSIAGYDRPAPNPHQSRSVIMARSGIVATSQPLAAQAGLEILKAGGNAADAAIAASAVIGLTEPMSCGIGGDLFVIYWDSKSKKLYGLNASGRSPYGLTRAAILADGHTEIPQTGPLSWSVPGCVDGWDELRRRFGSRSFAELLKPAIAYAEGGFPVSEIIAGGWRDSAKSLAEWPDSERTYLIEGQAPEAGEMFKNANLAASYRLIAEKGRDAFYKGDIARKVVAFSEQNGGH